MQASHPLRLHARALAVLLMLGLLPLEGRTESFERPLWETGIFAAYGRLPDYPGSDEYESYPFALPFFIYRGRYVESDRGGLSGVLYRSARQEVKLGSSGAPPVSDNNEAREGMGGLDPLFELGLTYTYHLVRTEEHRVYASASVRQVGSIDDDLNIRGEGVTARLDLTYRDYALFGSERWRYGTRIGVRANSARYHDYFYAVAPEFTTATRAEFDPDSGYGGFTLSQNVLYKHSRRVWWGAYIAWFNVSGAAFRDSALVREENNVILGTAVILRAAESERMVTRGSVELE